jgi:protein SCO1
MTPSPRRPATLPVYLVLAVALAAGIGLFAGQRWSSAPAADAPPTLQNGLAYPQPRALPDFSLDTPDGQLDGSALRGRWTLVFIGFTHCPDICPTTLAQLAEAGRRADLPPAQRPQLLFVSVDPERDTPEVTANYARHFSPEALGATADHDRLEPFTRSLGMVYMHSPLDGGGYSVDHSSSVAVVDPAGRLVAQLRPPFDPARIAADLRSLVGAGA